MPTQRRCVLRCKPRGRLFFFPTEETRRKIWLEAFSIANSKQRYLFACARHFSPVMFNTKYLRQTAYPDINLPQTSRIVPLIEQVWFANSCEPIGPKHLHDSVIETLEPFSTVSNQLIVIDRKVQTDQQDVKNLGQHAIIMQHMINRLQNELLQREHTIAELKLQIKNQNTDLEESIIIEQL